MRNLRETRASVKALRNRDTSGVKNLGNHLAELLEFADGEKSSQGD